MLLMVSMVVIIPIEQFNRLKERSANDCDCPIITNNNTIVIDLGNKLPIIDYKNFDVDFEEQLVILWKNVNYNKTIDYENFHVDDGSQLGSWIFREIHTINFTNINDQSEVIIFFTAKTDYEIFIPHHDILINGSLIFNKFGLLYDVQIVYYGIYSYYEFRIEY